MTAHPLILGTAGHIDHGKTALVKALTGVDTDRLPQEKQRGITIDIGFARLELGDVELGIVDVPGHERFVRNMVAGASGIDLAMLIIAADDSVMPQTREHLAILRLLGVQRGVIVLTKVDRAEAAWVDLVADEARRLVAGTFLDDAPIVRTSAVTGHGLDDLRDALRAVADRHVRDDDEHPFRLAVDRSFTMPGLGTVVTGTVWSGAAAVGDELEWLPGGRSIQVRGLQSFGRSAPRVERGQRAAVNITGAHHTDIHRGHELATPGYLRASRVLSVRLDVLPESPWPVRHGARHRLHVGTQEVMARVALLEARALAPGESGLAQFITASPTVATGRQPFVLRAESPVVTIGGGIVLRPAGPRVLRRNTALRDTVRRLATTDATARVDATVEILGQTPWDVLSLARDAGIAPAAAADAVATLVAGGRLVRGPGPGGSSVSWHATYLARVESRVCSALDALHDESPLATAFVRSAVLQRIADLGLPVIDLAIARLIERGEVVGNREQLARRGRGPQLSANQRALRTGIIEAFAAGAFTPPSVDDLVAALRRPVAEVRAIIDLLLKTGDLRRIDGAILLDAAHEDVLRRRVLARLDAGPGLTVSELRELLGTSRKYAVPFAEYLDRLRITRRDGDVRVRGPAADAATEPTP